MQTIRVTFPRYAKAYVLIKIIIIVIEFIYRIRFTTWWLIFHLGRPRVARAQRPLVYNNSFLDIRFECTLVMYGASDTLLYWLHVMYSNFSC